MEKLNTDRQQETPAAEWREKGEPDPHGNTYDCERATLTMGNLTDDELANGAFMNYDRPLNVDGSDMTHPFDGHSPVDMWDNAVSGWRREIDSMLAASPSQGLCEDEGCPHHGTPHVCITSTAEQNAQVLDVLIPALADGVMNCMSSIRFIEQRARDIRSGNIPCIPANRKITWKQKQPWPNHNWCVGCSPESCSGCGTEPLERRKDSDDKVLLDFLDKNLFEVGSGGAWIEEPTFSVQRVTGNRNDRQWKTIGRGDTLRDAIRAAMRQVQAEQARKEGEDKL